MPTRDLSKNSKLIQNRLDKIADVAERGLMTNYNQALDEIRAEISRLYEVQQTGELTRAQRTKLVRQVGLENRIRNILAPYLERNKGLLGEASRVSFDQSFLGHAWAVDQASGVALNWGSLSEEAVRTAVGLGDDYESLRGFVSEGELKRHKNIMDDAFRLYDKDSRKWISREVTQGVIKGESVQKVAKRIKDKGITKSHNSAMRIARTETNRATGMGSQIAYDKAEEEGVKIRQVWDAVLDMRTRPDHGAADGLVMDKGVFHTPWGDVPGPRRSGKPAQDINCRCTVVPESEGYTPSVRRTREDGLIPYKTFRQWAAEKGRSANQYGQKYDFLQG